MKKAVARVIGPVIIPCIVAASLTGCAAVTNVRNFLSDPQTVVAVATLKGWTQILVCAVGTGTNIAGVLESQINAGNSIQATNGKIFVVSSSVCGLLGGTAATPTSSDLTVKAVSK